MWNVWRTRRPLDRVHIKTRKLMVRWCSHFYNWNKIPQRPGNKIANHYFEQTLLQQTPTLTIFNNNWMKRFTPTNKDARMLERSRQNQIWQCLILHDQTKDRAAISRSTAPEKLVYTFRTAHAFKKTHIKIQTRPPAATRAPQTKARSEWMRLCVANGMGYF